MVVLAGLGIEDPILHRHGGLTLALVELHFAAQLYKLADQCPVGLEAVNLGLLSILGFSSAPNNQPGDKPQEKDNCNDLGDFVELGKKGGSLNAGIA